MAMMESVHQSVLQYLLFKDFPWVAALLGIYIYIYIKVKISCYRPKQALGDLVG
jgi:hypothetical protein